MAEIIFIILGIGTLISGILVISAKNPVHGVISLVITFGNITGLLLLIGVEFLGILFLLVYVGAIAILFLFVIMMINIKIEEILENTTRYIPIGILIGIVFYIEITILLKNIYPKLVGEIWIPEYVDFSKIYEYPGIMVIGEMLYKEYPSYIIIASIILLVALIAAIVLTLTHDEKVKRQDLFTQVATDYKQTIHIKK